jgi:hypothetical protein
MAYWYSSVEICRTAVDCGGGVVGVDFVVGDVNPEHIGEFATGIWMSPITEQCSESEHAISDEAAIPNPVGNGPDDHVCPPLIVTAATPDVPLLASGPSLTPIVVQSSREVQTICSIESPAMMGVSEKCTPPSVVASKVASAGIRFASVAVPANPTHNVAVGHESELMVPSPEGNGLMTNE